MKKHSVSLLPHLMAIVLLFSACSKDLPPVEMEMVVTPTSGQAPLSVSVNARVISGEVTHYTWDFGNGTKVYDVPWFTHKYSQPGQYRLQLIVEGVEGTDKDPQPVTKTYETLISVSQPVTPPSASFHFTPVNNIIADQTPVTFISTATGTINSWYWNFGSNEGASSSKDPVYVFKTAGNKTVSHTASGPLGYSNISKTVTVHAMDPACNNYSSGTTHSASAIQTLRSSNQVKFGKLRIQNNYSDQIYVEMYYPDYWLGGDYKPVYNVYWTIGAGVTTTLAYQNTPMSIGTDWGVRVRFTNGVISCVRTVADVSTLSNGNITVNAVKTYNGY
ncbi:MAG: PKD domain-containing protein [Saprospiraceae bacterium]|nr:PKD domain-containing protein [Saprospiraceae bacterium]